MTSHEAGESQRDAMKSLIHEIRNPLNTISVSAELAKLQIETGKPTSAILKSLDRIIEECRQCSRILTANNDQ